MSGLVHVTATAKDDGYDDWTCQQLFNGTPPCLDTADPVSFDIVVGSDGLWTTDDEVMLDEDPDPNPWPIDVLGNDILPAGATVTAVSQGTLGTVAIAPDGGAVRYAPATNAHGMDTFTYTATDSTGKTEMGTVFVLITEINDDPDALNDTITVTENAPATGVPVLANDSDVDGDALTITGMTNGAKGGVVITGGGTGLTYQPNPGATGADSFTYTIADGRGGSASATVAVTITAARVAPITAAPDARIRKQTVGTKTTKVRVTWSATSGAAIASYKVQLQVDGGAWTTIDARATTPRIDRTFTNARTYRFRVRATDRRGATGRYAYSPTFRIWRFQDSSAEVHLDGHWTTKRVSGPLGSHSFSASSAASATLLTTMRDIAVVSTRTPRSGRAEVWIDGSLAATIDLHAGSKQYREVVFRHHFATLAGHTVELRPVGDGRIHLDAVLVLR